MNLADTIKESLVRKSGMASRPKQGSGPHNITSGLQRGHASIIEREESPGAIGELVWLSRNCNAIRLSIDTIKNYVFRNGIEFEPVYSRACRECGAEFDPETEPEYCNECDHGRDPEDVVAEDGQWYEEPSETEMNQVRDWLQHVDQNGNTFMDALRAYEEWLNVLDDAFMVVRQDYDLDDEGNILDWKVEELFVADSSNMRITGDPDTLQPGGEYWICLSDSCRPGPDPDEQQDNTLWSGGTGQGRVYYAPGHCEHCGRKLHEVWYVATDDTATSEPVNYYLEREVIHTSKYSATYGYGYSPIMSIYDMATLLISQERYMRTFYEEERTPRIMVSVQTRNPEKVRPLKQSMEDKNVSQGGHHIPFVTYPGEAEGGGFQVHELSKLPEELDYENVRDEAYRRIGATYGINAAIQGNVDAGGLQNQGPAQWQVTDRAVEIAQSVHNEKLFPQLKRVLRLECDKCNGEGGACEACGGDGRVQLSDWNVKLAEAKEQDNLEETQVQLARVQEAMQMQQLGFEVKRRNPDGTFVFSDEPSEDPMGGMQGGPGGGRIGGGGGAGGWDARPRSSFGSFGHESSAEDNV